MAHGAGKAASFWLVFHREGCGTRIRCRLAKSQACAASDPLAGMGRLSTLNRKYLLNGWLPPLTQLSDPDYCEYGCPVCRAARRGNRLARALQKIELFLTRGGCGWGRARQRKYGVTPDESRQGDST